MKMAIWPDKYKNLQDFLDDINTMGDIEFSYAGTNYSIYFDGEEFYIAEFDKPETGQTFKSPEDFAEHFKVEGKPFKAFVTDIDVLLH